MTPSAALSLEQCAARVKLLALDSDGVLTDGGVYMAADGQENRRFDIKDGLGLKRVMAAGIRVAIVSGGSAPGPVTLRAHALGIEEVHTSIPEKLAVVKALCEKFQINLEEVAYMGDDLPDLPVLAAVGLPCAPADAIEAVL
ncbi:MAG: HAD family hydrolase, partial [Anaerolineae bacterium]|nr:HAD family hydrolase [Anaerolineae bacterium]